MYPQEWYDKGKQSQYMASRLTYYKGGLEFTSDFHFYAWHGIGDALNEMGDANGASEAFGNEEKSRQGLEVTISAHLRESLYGMPASSQLLSNNTKRCPTCGISVPADAQYCSRCGASLGAGVIGYPTQTVQNAPYRPSPTQTTPAHVYGGAGIIVAIIGAFILPLPLGFISILLGGVGLSKDREKGISSAAMCVGLIDLIYGIILLTLTLS